MSPFHPFAKKKKFVGNANPDLNQRHCYIDAHSVYLVTFCGTGVKPNPRLSDITNATAPKEVTPSGTDIFSLVQVLSLTEMTEKKNKKLSLLSRFCLKNVFAVNLLV